MTIVIPNFLTQKAVVGLNTYQYTIQTAGVHSCRISVDHLNESTLTVSIVQAGSVNTTLATATLPGGTTPAGAPQGTITLIATANCAASDTISFVLTSSNPADQQLNTVKAKLNVHMGVS